jgi:hypothetical protein
MQAEIPLPLFFLAPDKHKLQYLRGHYQKYCFSDVGTVPRGHRHFMRFASESMAKVAQLNYV